MNNLQDTKSPKKVLKSDLILGSCVFCENDANLRSMHKEYHFDGEMENYTTMLLLCFNIKVVGLIAEDEENEICETCINRLRDAFIFRKQVEAVHEKFKGETFSDLNNDANEIPQKCRKEKLKDSISEKSKEHVRKYSKKQKKCKIKKELAAILNDSDDDQIYEDISYENLKIESFEDVPLDFNPKEESRPRIKRENVIEESFDEPVEDSLDPSVDLHPQEAGYDETKEEKSVPPLEPFATVCPVCGDKFHVHRDLVQHYSTHFPNYLCDICGKAFINKVSLARHKSVHLNKRQTCEICHKSYASRNALSQHTRIKHQGEKSYCCRICSERFSDYSLRSKHLSTVHGEPTRLYTCNICNRTFFRCSRLTEHIKRDHYRQKNHSCELCGYEFFTKGELREHMLRHTGEKNFGCEKCGKSFARKKTLTEHLKIHANLRAHKCQICGKAFVQKCTLKGHLKTHGIVIGSNTQWPAVTETLQDGILNQSEDKSRTNNMPHSC